MLKTILRLLRNPKVLSVLMWLVPIVIGWMSDKSKTSSKKTATSRRSK